MIADSSLLAPKHGLHVKKTRTRSNEHSLQTEASNAESYSQPIKSPSRFKKVKEGPEYQELAVVLMDAEEHGTHRNQHYRLKHILRLEGQKQCDSKDGGVC